MAQQRTELIREAKKLGYEPAGRAGNGHLKFVHRELRVTVQIPCTPGRGRCFQNTLAQLRRPFRRCDGR